ncbi:MAG: energy transducer TonB [Candidatus Omnitrophota bacterium]|nr:energy transducer TonB [Candidatus Omnitrophota bacterium]
MVSDRILRVTFAISLLTHGAILLQSPNLNPFSPPPKKQTIEVRYIKENPQTKPLLKSLAKPDSGSRVFKSDPFLNLDAKIGSGSRVPPPYVERENVFKGSKVMLNKPPDFAKPTFINSQVLAIKKKITLPTIEMAKIDNPSYISYYQIVREKIRRSAYQNYTHNEIGEVYVSFVISNDGYIKDVRLVEERSAVNDYLRDIALRSVKDASPFPNFPKELDYPQLSFNIIISFEIE